MFENIDAKKFQEMLEKEKDNLEIIDVREPEEYNLIKIKNFKIDSTFGNWRST